LLNSGAIPQACDDAGDNSLMVALRQSDLDIVEMLLQSHFPRLYSLKLVCKAFRSLFLAPESSSQNGQHNEAKEALPNCIFIDPRNNNEWCGFQLLPSHVVRVIFRRFALSQPHELQLLKQRNDADQNVVDIARAEGIILNPVIEMLAVSP